MAFTWHTRPWYGPGTGREWSTGTAARDGFEYLAGFLLLLSLFLLLLLLLLRATLALQDGVSTSFFVVVLDVLGKSKSPDGGCSRYHTTPRARKEEVERGWGLEVESRYCYLLPAKHTWTCCIRICLTSPICCT